MTILPRMHRLLESRYPRELSRLERYLAAGLNNVQGWLSTYSAEFIAVLSEIQHKAGYTGAVGEIGVHHGKLFILLLLTASRREKAFAIDVFEAQDLNTDRSGRGDIRIFRTNVRRWAGSDCEIQVIAKSSLEVHPSDIVAVCGKVRLVSVDGGHTQECTVNDLFLADAVLQDWGIAIVDDFFNPNWPDVSTGVAKYLTNRNSKLAPFAISPNKVYLCNPQYAMSYRSEIRQHFRLCKESWMFGSAVDIYGTGPRTETLASFTKWRIKESVIGPRLLAFRGFIRGKHGVGSPATAGWRYRLSWSPPRR